MHQCEVVISDNLDCSPLLQIRDAQAQGSVLNQNSQPTAYGTGVPIAPSGMNFVQVDFNMVNNADSPSYSLPNRQRSSHLGGPGSIGRVTSVSDSLSPSGSDKPPSPANERNHSSRTNSTKDASSHSSFTPPSTTNASDSNDQRQGSVSTSKKSQGTGQTPSAFGTGTFFNNNAMDNSFASFQPEFFGQPMGSSSGFTMNNFEIPGVDINMSTGMTPMASDSDWNRIMEDMDRFASKNNAQNNG